MKPECIKTRKATLTGSFAWAENETRTRDPDLGKVVLYQLSYFRKLIAYESEEKETRTPTTQLSLPPQSSASTNSAISPDDTENILCAQNRTRTCTSLNTRTWNERVYHSATWAKNVSEYLERKTRLELATPTLARSCSTNWAISAKDACSIKFISFCIPLNAVAKVQLFF